VETDGSVPLAREGLPFVGVGATATLVAFLVGWSWLAWAGVVVTAFLASFFRDPQRTPPPGDSIVAPADGRVLKAERVQDDRFLHGPAQQVSIFMSPANVHVNRNPSSGRVLEVRYNHGRYFRAFADKASLDNEQNAVVLEDAHGRRLAFIQIAGFLARRIVCYLQPGMMVERAERCGLIMFGSRVDIFLPPEAKLRVEVGQRTRAGETVVAEWPT
jgi:phosphatidylserine decarboxylase